MPRAEYDEIRQQRIDYEIIVDAYGPEEQAMGWYYYLDDHLSLPFKGKCIFTRTISPLETGDEVEVVGMTSADECEHEMFVQVKWHGRKFAVPLAQIAVVEADEATREAVEDWHYWANQGCGF